MGWEYAYRRCQTGPNADVYRVPQESLLMIWRNQLRAITSQHVRKSRPALAVKLTEYLKKAARETGFLSGKWLVFGGGRSIEVQWVKVKEAVCASKLGACAKLSEKTHGDPRVICVYTYSFEDEVDVWRTLRALHAMDVYPTTWKPDILTHLSHPALKQGWFAPEGKRDHHNVTGHTTTKPKTTTTKRKTTTAAVSTAAAAVSTAPAAAGTHASSEIALPSDVGVHLKQYECCRAVIKKIEEDLKEGECCRAEKIERNLKVGECVLYRDFVAAYNCEGSKIQNLVLVCLHRDVANGPLKVFKFNNLCDDKDSRSADPAYVADVFEFYFGKNGDPEFKCSFFKQFHRVYISGDHGTHFSSIETMFNESRFKELYGVEFVMFFLCSYHMIQKAQCLTTRSLGRMTK